MYNLTSSATSERLEEVIEVNSNMSSKTRGEKRRANYSCHQRLDGPPYSSINIYKLSILLCTYTILISSMAAAAISSSVAPSGQQFITPPTSATTDNGQEAGNEADLVPLLPLTHQSELRPVDQQQQQPKYEIFDSLDESSTGSVIEHAEDNQITFGTMEGVGKERPPQIKPIDEASAAFLDSLGPKSSKNRRRPAEYQVKTADWWTSINQVKAAPIAAQQQPQQQQSERQEPIQVKRVNVAKGRPATKTSTFSQTSNRSVQPKGFVYKEQPLKQNEIITLKYQLNAIRNMQKSLVTKPMNQLQKLDNRLVESYKLCLKKKMPLYAGMLYRTRDFAVRMAKEVQQERRILDGMAKQVQLVLRERMTNKTLVKEFNKIMANPLEANVDVRIIATILSLSKNVIPRVKKNVTTHQLQQQHSTKTQAINLSNDGQHDVTTQRTQVVAAAATAHEMETRLINGGQSGKSSNSASKRLVGKALVASKGYGAGTATKSTGEDAYEDDNETVPVKKATTKQVVRYTVNVNEVNLKKELTKTQHLIDRINVSCHDLTGVIDDIIYLFKLTNSNDTQSRNKGGKPNKMDKFLNQIASSGSFNFGGGFSGNLMDNKQAKKLLRSPIRVLFERFGRLTMANESAPQTQPSTSTSPQPPLAINSAAVMMASPAGGNLSLSSTPVAQTTTTASPPPPVADFRPLFEPSSLVYVEPRDPDLGFEVSPSIDPDSSF